MSILLPPPPVTHKWCKSLAACCFDKREKGKVLLGHQQRANILEGPLCFLATPFHLKQVIKDFSD